MIKPVTKPVVGRPPAAEAETRRNRLRVLLTAGPKTARALSEEAGLPEKEVLTHLTHLARSGGPRGEPLEIAPARCLACGFVFATRDRLTRPGRCPDCRASRIAPPSFQIATRAG
ncbi:MAG TPA: transcriptional regulator [Polyangia bacterium]